MLKYLKVYKGCRVQQFLMRATNYEKYQTIGWSAIIISPSARGTSPTSCGIWAENPIKYSWVFGDKWSEQSWRDMVKAFRLRVVECDRLLWSFLSFWWVRRGYSVNWGELFVLTTLDAHTRKIVYSLYAAVTWFLSTDAKNIRSFTGLNFWSLFFYDFITFKKRMTWFDPIRASALVS